MATAILTHAPHGKKKISKFRTVVTVMSDDERSGGEGEGGMVDYDASQCDENGKINTGKSPFLTYGNYHWSIDGTSAIIARMYSADADDGGCGPCYNLGFLMHVGTTSSTMIVNPEGGGTSKPPLLKITCVAQSQRYLPQCYYLMLDKFQHKGNGLPMINFKEHAQHDKLVRSMGDLKKFGGQSFT
jgi:hypothetical protein